MSSVNHQFYDKQPAYKKYRKTVAHLLTGKRLDPYNAGRQIGWVLQTPRENFDYESQRPKQFSYEDEVIELYDQNDERLFRRLNRPLFDQGLLVEFTGEEPTFAFENELSDAEVEEIAKIKQLTAYVKRLENITSKITLERIRSATVAHNRTIKFIEAIDAKLK